MTKNLSSQIKPEDKILLASYILLTLAYGTMFYLKWKEKTKK
jgi:hypothetical protein